MSSKCIINCGLGSFPIWGTMGTKKARTLSMNLKMFLVFKIFVAIVVRRDLVPCPGTQWAQRRHKVHNEAISLWRIVNRYDNNKTAPCRSGLYYLILVCYFIFWFLLFVISFLVLYLAKTIPIRYPSRNVADPFFI